MRKLITILSQPVLLLTLVSAAHAQTLNVPPPVNIPANISLGNVISAVVGILLLISAIAAFLYLILGGLQWITSGGDKTGMEAARNKITAAIVGLIIVAAAWAIMMLVGQFVGVNFLNNELRIPTIGNPQGT